ncbi:MAG: hypothetical protein AB1797_03795 [bacterium]
MNLAVAVYEKLKPKIGEDGANAIVDYVDSKIEETAVTKLDLMTVENNLGTEIQKVENNLGVEIHNLRTEIQRVENKLEAEIQQLRTEMSSMESRLKAEIEIKIKDIEWKMKAYFLALVTLMVITNPKVLDILARLLGIIK